MAIQYRRGQFSDFDPSKLKPGEPAVVLSGDPDSTDGQSVYFCFNAGNVKRIATTNDILLSAYPVGSIYLSVNNTNPGTLFGGTWVRWGTGRVPVGVDTTQTEFNTVEKTGGEKTHTLSSNELAKHQHRLDGHAFSWGTNKGSVWIQGTTATLGQGTSGNPLYTTQGESDYTYDTGSTEAHNNLQPYITCYMWKRTV